MSDRATGIDRDCMEPSSDEEGSTDLGEVLGGVALHDKKVKHRHKRKPLIYKISSPSGKAYIGQTCWWTQRMWKHANGKSKCPGLNNAVAKYGWDRMHCEVIWEGPEEKLDAMEIKLIREHDTVRNGYNILPGGEFNPAKDPASLEKMRIGWQNGTTRAKHAAAFTPEVRANMSASQKARCARDGNAQVRAAAAKGLAKANLAKHSPAAKAKARATRERTRQLKAAGLIPRGRSSTSKRAGNLRENCGHEEQAVSSESVAGPSGTQLAS